MSFSPCQDIVDTTTETLHRLIMDPKLDLVQIRSIFERRPELALKSDPRGWTLVHYAVARQNVAALELAHEFNIPIHSVTVEAVTPLHLASTRESVEVAQKLLQYLDPKYIDDIDREGNSALHLASMHGRNEIIVLLLQCG